MATHIPVLLNETISLLNLKEGGIYVDLTLGRAGHSKEILKAIPKGHLYCFDQDEEAIVEGGEELKKVGNNFTIVKSNFADVKSALNALNVFEVDGILADLGVSSPQLDEAYRGFSYQLEAPLDMRMDLSSPLTAEKVVNSYSLQDLSRVISEYGEDRDAYRIAKEIVRQREISPLKTTFDLVSCIKKAKGPKTLSKKGHPAKQTFQAIRMEVNGEMDALKRMLEDAPYLLKSGGRLAIITFMSLDDRAVKNRFKELGVKVGSREIISLPGEEKEPEFKILTKHPIVPSEEELKENHRSASSKLRGLERK